jgi:molybdenum cofactor cytidylyltransferase
MVQIAAIVLAAGGSSRLGQPKQLLRFQGQSLIRRVTEAAAEAGCSPIIVVTGTEPDSIVLELQGLPALFVSNPNWQRGIGTSIRAGVQHLAAHSPETDAALILACDQPHVDRETLRALIELRAADKQPIVACAYDGTLGIPALFDRSFFNQLCALKVDGAKKIIEANRGVTSRLDFPAGAIDIDTMEDYERLLGSDKR